MMCFEGTVIKIKRLRKTNCTRIFHAHVIQCSIQLFRASAGNSAKHFPRGAGTDLAGGTCTEGKMFCTIACLSLK